MCMCVHMCVIALSCALLYCSLPYFLGPGFPTEPEAHYLDVAILLCPCSPTMMAYQKAPDAIVSLPKLQCGSNGARVHTQLFIRVGGSVLTASRVCSKVSQPLSLTLVRDRNMFYRQSTRFNRDHIV